jgi:nucleotide-binding universal stress UspA family protein
VKTAYRNVLVAVPPPSFEWYRQPVDVIRKTAATLSLVAEVNLTFLSVYSVVTDMGDGEVNLLPPEVFMDAVAQHEKQLKADVENYVKWFAENGVRYSIVMKKGDDTADTIIQTARETGADLIVMGTHHDHSIFDIFSPDVARKIIKHAPCDVMLVAPRK